MKQIGFIVGTGRCGTTILAQVLNSHSKICVPHELQIIVSIENGDRLYDKFIKGELDTYSADDFIHLIASCCPYHFERYFDYITHFKKLSYPQGDLRKILKELFDHICFEQSKEIFLEQTPWYGQRLDILKELFPQMKVIHLVRDGRDVAISFARTSWWSKDIEKNLLQWEKEVNVIRTFGTRWADNFVEVRYEDLVRAPEYELAKILNLFGAKFEKEMLNPEGLFDYSAFFRGITEEHQSNGERAWAGKKDRVFFSDSVGTWKRFKDYNFSQLPSNVSRTLKLLNYEA